MASVAVFDRQPVAEETEFWRELFVENDNRHVANADTVAVAMTSLVDLIDQRVEMPDVIMIGDGLQNVHKYIESPHELPMPMEPSGIKRGMRAAKRLAESQLLLPQLVIRNVASGMRGNIELPRLRERQRALDLEHAQQAYDKGVRRDKLEKAAGIFIIGHTARLLFGDRCPMIAAVSDRPLPDTAPVDIVVNRTTEGSLRLQSFIANGRN